MKKILQINQSSTIIGNAKSSGVNLSYSLIKIVFTIFLFLGSISNSFSQIWCNPLTTGRPIASYYLGDKLTTPWYINFEIGQSSWNASEAGIGQNTDGATGWDWAAAIWYQDGAGSNKDVRRDIGGFQFNVTGTWYFVGRAKANSGDAWTYADEGVWSNQTTLSASTTSGNCPYFSVSALGDPSSCTASITGTTATLGWTKFTGGNSITYNVMIVRYPKNASPTPPADGTGYALNASIGAGTVVYATSTGSSTSNTVTANTDYDYYFYSENWSYYSAGVKVTAIAPLLPSVYNVTGGPASYCQGSGGVSVGLDGSQSGVNYTLKNGATTVTVKPGTGSAIDFGLQLNGTYTVSAAADGSFSTIFGSNTMTGSAVITEDPLPVAAGTIAGPATVTQGDLNHAYTVPAIGNATSYNWAYSGDGATITGTGTDVTIDFSAIATSGTLSVYGLNACGDGTPATIDITVNPFIPAPTTFNVTGNGGKYCGTTGSPVGLDGSETGVTYTLSPVGTTTAGTGSAISFGNQLAGNYTISGTNAGGTTAMTGSASITTTIAPVAHAGDDYIVFKTQTQVLENAFATNSTSVFWTKTVSAGSGTLSSYTIEKPTFTATIDGPANFTFTATGYPGCGTNSDDAIFTVVSNNPVVWLGVNEDWNDPTNWFWGAVPVAENDVRIPNTNSDIYPTLDASGSNVYCKNIVIEVGASLIDNGKLILSSGGTLTFQQPTVTNDRWHYISSPVSGAVSSMFTGDFLYDFSTSSNDYTPILSTSASLDPMKGYALYVDAGYHSDYIGTLNDNPSYGITASAAGQGWNLVGNPYPSAIDWDKGGWDKSGIDKAIYIYKGGSTWSSYVDGAHINGGSNIIAATQGFFVKGNGGTFSMTNAVRVHDNTVPFYKSTIDIVPNLVRLEVSGNGYKDESVVRFKSEATSEYDGDFDALKRFGDTPEAAQVYTLGSIPLSINSMPETDKVPVGVKVGTNGTYTIAATEINDMPYITLEDKETGVYTNLSDGPYTFESVAGDFTQRFVLHFSLLAVEETKKVSAIVYSYQQTVHINLKDQVIGDIYIYNIAGQLISTKRSAQGTNEIKLPNVGNYIVKVITKNNTMVRKVFIQ